MKSQSSQKYVWFPFALFILFTLSLISCKESTTPVLRIEYHKATPVPDSAWVQIDEYKMIHSPHDFEWKPKNFFPNENGEGMYSFIPTSRVFYYHPQNQEKRVMEKITSFHILKNLGTKLLSLKKDGKNIYKVVNPTEYLTSGVAKIARVDNQPIKASASKENPIRLDQLHLSLK